MSIDLSKAKKIHDDILKPLANKVDLKLYDEANDKNITVSELLEEKDPSPEGSKLDAFQRQLAISGMCVSDPRNAPTVEQLFNGTVSHLTAEFVRRQIMKGFNMYWADPNSLIAFETPITGNSAHPMYISNKDVKGGSLGKRSDGSTLKTVEILYQEKEVKVKEYGKVLNVSYKVVKNKSTIEFAHVLQLIGLNLAADQIGDIYTVIKDGDGTIGAADTTESSVAGVANMVYADYVDLLLGMDAPFTLNAVIMNAVQLGYFLKMAEVKDPLAFTDPFIRNGKIMTPFGFVINRYDGAADRYIAGIDARFAIARGVAQPLMIEADKIIARKMDNVAISEDVAYWVGVGEAREVLDFQS